MGGDDFGAGLSILVATASTIARAARLCPIRAIADTLIAGSEEGAVRTELGLDHDACGTVTEVCATSGAAAVAAAPVTAGTHG